MPIRVIVLGEGKDEEGEVFYPPNPGRPVPEEQEGAAHILVRRALERLGVAAKIVQPPLLREQRRPGNGGLIADLKGEPRLKASNRQQPWLTACVGQNKVDLVVVLKDAAKPGGAEEKRQEIAKAVARRPGGLEVIAAAATPSIEAFLLLIDENEGLTEAEAKERWKKSEHRTDSKAAIARTLDLDALAAKSPDGFGDLVKRLASWLEHRGKAGARPAAAEG